MGLVSTKCWVLSLYWPSKERRRRRLWHRSVPLSKEPPENLETPLSKVVLSKRHYNWFMRRLVVPLPRWRKCLARMKAWPLHWLWLERMQRRQQMIWESCRAPWVRQRLRLRRWLTPPIISSRCWRIMYRLICAQWERGYWKRCQISPRRLMRLLRTMISRGRYRGLRHWWKMRRERFFLIKQLFCWFKWRNDLISRHQLWADWRRFSIRPQPRCLQVLWKNRLSQCWPPEKLPLRIRMSWPWRVLRPLGMRSSSSRHRRRHQRRRWIPITRGSQRWRTG